MKTNQEEKMLAEAHKWVYDALRIHDRYSWTKIGELFEKSDKGAKYILENGTGSLSQLQAVAKKIGRESEFKNIIGYSDQYKGKQSELFTEEFKADYITPEKVNDLVEALIEHEESLRKNNRFKLWLKSIKQEAVIEFMTKQKRD